MKSEKLEGRVRLCHSRFDNWRFGYPDFVYKMSYLDTQFPSLASVIDNIQSEDDRLKTQLESAVLKQRTAREAAVQAAQEKSSRLKATVSKIPTDPDAVNELLSQVDEQQKTRIASQVRQIQESLEYRQTLQYANSLLSIGEEVVSKLDLQSFTDASKGYQRSQDLIGKLKSIAGGRSREMAVQVLEQYESTVTQPLMEVLQNRLAAELQASQWPKKVPESLAFVEALSDALRAEDEAQAVLESFAELAAPLDLRVRYNFESDRETNRADKPEWLLNHFFKQVDPHIHWLTTTVQPILEERFPDRFALIELCSALLPSYYRVLQSYFEQVKYSPDLLNHLMSEAISFDADLHNRYFYKPATSTEERWSGLATSLLNFHPEWFDLWLESERQAAHSQYDEILAAPTAWDIDWDSASSFFTHPTVSAINITQLFDTITDVYRDLLNPTFQLRMVSDIQVELVENYCRLLTERVALYSTVHSSIGRAVGSVSAEDKKKLQGLSGLQYLGKALGSCDYVLNFLRDKSNELLFFEMAERVGEPSVFEMNLQEFEMLKERTIKEVIKCIFEEFQKVTKSYYRQDWKLVSDQEYSSDIDHIKSHMLPFVDFVEKLAGKSDSTLIMHKLTARIAKNMFQHVVQGNTFSLDGGRQLLKDVEDLWSTLRLVHEHEATRLLQASQLLSDNNVETPVFDDQERSFILKRSRHY